jgi:hypothetical protein
VNQVMSGQPEVFSSFPVKLYFEYIYIISGSRTITSQSHNCALMVKTQIESNNDSLKLYYFPINHNISGFLYNKTNN